MKKIYLRPMLPSVMYVITVAGRNYPNVKRFTFSHSVNLTTFMFCDISAIQALSCGHIADDLLSFGMTPRNFDTNLFSQIGRDLEAYIPTLKYSRF